MTHLSALVTSALGFQLTQRQARSLALHPWCRRPIIASTVANSLQHLAVLKVTTFAMSRVVHEGLALAFSFLAFALAFSMKSVLSLKEDLLDLVGHGLNGLNLFHDHRQLFSKDHLGLIVIIQTDEVT